MKRTLSGPQDFGASAPVSGEEPLTAGVAPDHDAGRCGEQNGIATCTLGPTHTGRHHDQTIGAKWGHRSLPEFKGDAARLVEEALRGR